MPRTKPDTGAAPIFKDAADLRRSPKHEAYALGAVNSHAHLVEALAKISRSLDAQVSMHRCSCTHPCDDYFVHPGPCGARQAETYRNIKVVADAALSELEGRQP